MIRSNRIASKDTDGVASLSTSVTTPLLSFATLPTTSSFDLSSCRRSNSSDCNKAVGLSTSGTVSSFGHLPEQVRPPSSSSSRWQPSVVRPAETPTSVSAQSTTPLLDIDLAFFPALSTPANANDDADQNQTKQQVQSSPVISTKPPTTYNHNLSSTANTDDQGRDTTRSLGSNTSPNPPPTSAADRLREASVPNVSCPLSTDVNLNDPSPAEIASSTASSLMRRPNSAVLLQPTVSFRQLHPEDAELQNDRWNWPNQQQPPPQQQQQQPDCNRPVTETNVTSPETDSLKNHLPHHRSNYQQPQFYQQHQQPRRIADNVPPVNNSSLLSTLEFIDDYVE